MGNVTPLTPKQPVNKLVDTINHFIDNTANISGIVTTPLNLIRPIIDSGMESEYAKELVHAVRAVPHFLNLICNTTPLGTLSDLLTTRILEIDRHYIKFVIEMHDYNGRRLSIVVRSALAKEWPIVQDDLEPVSEATYKQIKTMECPVTYSVVSKVIERLNSDNVISRKIIRECHRLPEGCTGIAYSNQAIPSRYNIMIELITPINLSTHYEIT